MERQQEYRWWTQYASVKEHIQAILSECVGLENAITGKNLAVRVHAHERKVRAAIVELIEDGMPIGASSDALKGGYYVIATPQELEATRAILKARATEILQRDKALCRAWNQRGEEVVQPMLLGLEG